LLEVKFIYDTKDVVVFFDGSLYDIFNKTYLLKLKFNI